jgi:hypothetical protein
MPRSYSVTEGLEDIFWDLELNRTDLYANFFQKTEIRAIKLNFTDPLYEVKKWYLEKVLREIWSCWSVCFRF